MNTIKEDFSPRNYKPIIIIATVVLISTIFILLSLPGIQNFDAFDVTILPLINAILNVLSFVCLIAALIAIKKGNSIVHRRFIFGALGSTVLFLVNYVFFHIIASSTSFGGEGLLKFLYYLILVTHIVLAMSIIPLILLSITTIANRQFERHKKISRWTMPIWLYVSLSGVIVYLLIRPYY